jgi:hypothetical protein
MKKAIGGIVEDNIVESPGFSDYAKGGVLKKAKGGKVAGVSDPMTAREAMKGSVGFNSTPKIRK